MKLRKLLAVMFVILACTSAFGADIYDAEPSFSPYYAGSVKSTVLYDALEELNYIRWLAGVPNNVTLSTELTSKAQHGAVLLDAIDTLTHTPGKPADMSDTFYQMGYDATSHGNVGVAKIYYGSQVSGNMTISYSTRMYMKDSDSTNIARLGHRRWLMNPRLKQTGFGISTRRGYEVTYVIEDFAEGKQTLNQEEYARYLEWLKWPINDEFITWPANKHPHPLTYFDTETAWSVTLNRNVFNECTASNVSVRLIRENDGKVWRFGGSNSDGYFTIAPNNVAYDECIIFRPNGVTSYNNGEAWRVEVSGLSRVNGGSGSISYTVQFTGQADTTTPNTTTNTTPNDGTTTTRQEIHHYYHEDKKDDDCNPGWGAFTLLALAFGIPRKYSRWTINHRR